MHVSAPQFAPVLGLLDVGTAKVACAIVVVDNTCAPRLLGLGHQAARGLKSSVIIDTEEAEDAVRATIAQAEAMAGVRLGGVTLATAGGRLQSQYLSLGGNVTAGATIKSELDRLFAAVHEHARLQEQDALHLDAIAIALDAVPVREEEHVNRSGRLAVDAHLIAADQAPLRALRHVVERCQLRVDQAMPSPLVTALGVTTEAERQQGVVVLDCGAGTTGLAVFLGGRCVAAHVLQIGGNHLTYDITRELGLPVTECERIKKNYDMQEAALAMPRSGSAPHLAAQPALSSGIHAQSEHGHVSEQVTRARILPIITKRIVALLQNVAERLDRLALPAERLPLIVLTGGGAHLRLLIEHATQVFKRPARMGVPGAATGWPDVIRRPEFATLAGLQLVAIQGRAQLLPAPVHSASRGPINELRRAS